MGTPHFAVPSLKILVDNGFDIAAVITVPDKPAGRGLKVQMSPVKEYALENNLKVLQPVKLKDPEFIEELKQLNANLFIVVAFRMLPEIVWSMPSLGTFNLHASLLPNYRGAAPINWAVINGEKETGATTFFLQHKIDTGDIIDQVKIPILPNDSAGEVHDALMMKGAELVLKTTQQIANDEVQTRPQEHHNALKEAPKIFKEDCEIDWLKDAVQIHNFIRGLSPYPTAYTYLDKKVFKIFKTELDQQEVDYEIGSIITDNKTHLKIAVKGGLLNLLEVQLQGKKKMAIDAFLRGYTLVNKSINEK